MISNLLYAFNLRAAKLAEDTSTKVFLVQTIIASGWLDILSTGETPKPEAYYHEPQQYPCRLTHKTAISLLRNLSTLLLNFAGAKGVDVSNEEMVVQLEFAEKLAKIIFKSQITRACGELNASSSHTGEDQTNILASTSDDSMLTEALANLITWYASNYVSRGSYTA